MILNTTSSSSSSSSSLLKFVACCDVPQVFSSNNSLWTESRFRVVSQEYLWSCRNVFWPSAGVLCSCSLQSSPLHRSWALALVRWTQAQLWIDKSLASAEWKGWDLIWVFDIGKIIWNLKYLLTCSEIYRKSCLESNIKRRLVLQQH